MGDDVFEFDDTGHDQRQSSSSSGSECGGILTHWDTKTNKMGRTTTTDHAGVAKSTINLDRMVRFPLSSSSDDDGADCVDPTGSVVSSSDHRTTASSSSSQSGGGLSARREKLKNVLLARKQQHNNNNNDQDESHTQESAADGSTTSSLSQSTIGTIQPSTSSNPSRRRRRRRHLRRQYGTSSTNMDRRSLSQEDLSLSISTRASGSSSLSAQLARNNERTTSHVYMPTQASCGIRGAGTSVVAVQDAGSYRMLFDDCSYLCSTIGTTTTTNSSSTTTNTRPMLELAWLLAHKRKRGILVSSHGTNEALMAVLDALVMAHKGWLSASVSSHCKTRVGNRTKGWVQVQTKYTSIPNKQEEEGKDDFEHYTMQTNVDASLTTLGTTAAAASNTTTERKSALPRTCTGRLKLGAQQTTRNNHDESSGATRTCPNVLIRQPPLFSLVTMMHLISWDCTTHAPQSSSSSANAACRVRRVVLQHGGVIRLLCGWILEDSAVRHVLQEQVVLPSSTLQTHQKKQAETVDRNEMSSVAMDRNDEDQRGTKTKRTLSALEDSSASSVSPIRVDPTLLGRRRKKRRVLLGSIPEDSDKPFAFSQESPIKGTSAARSSGGDASTELNTGGTIEEASFYKVDTNSSLRLDDKMNLLKQQLRGSMSRRDGEPLVHTCGILVETEHGPDKGLPQLSHIALDALNRIVSGKEGDDVSCMESEIEIENRDNRLSQLTEEEQLRKNPMVITNNLLRESGSLPLLARAMSDTVMAVLILLRPSRASEQPPCQACLQHLRAHATALSSLIDGACCLTSENRIEFCADTSGSLIGSLLVLLQMVTNRMVAEPLPSNESIAMHELCLVALRTLTSLTHDNCEAGKQLMHAYRGVISTDGEYRVGARILVDLLVQTVEARRRTSSSRCIGDSTSAQHQVSFDMVVFCLNTLTNIIDSKGVREALAELTFADGRGFVQWLSQWVCKETSGFRDALLMASFGDTNNADRSTVESAKSTTTNRALEEDEEEPLVLAGNGCILLVCLMRRSLTTASASCSIQDAILTELPENGILIIQNTLKAFCNFYHYSLGDLSVAIVAPVGKLIADLDFLLANKR